MPGRPDQGTDGAHGGNGPGPGEARGGNGESPAEAKANLILRTSPQALEKAERRFQAIAPYLPGARPAIKPKENRSWIYKWLRRYELHGYEGLIDRPRSDRGRSRSIVHEDLAKCIKATYWEHCESSKSARPPYTYLLDVGAMKARELKVPEPTLHGIRRMLQPAMGEQALLMAKGPEAFLRDHAPSRPVYREFGPNQEWTIDHWTVHSEVLVNGKRRRVDLTLAQDRYCGTNLGWCFSQHGNTDSIGSALLMAFKRYGLPKRILCDRGKDMMSLRVAAGCRALGIELIFATGRSPKTKGDIERRFSQISRGYCRTIPGYAPGPHLKPANKKDPLTLEQLQDGLVKYLEILNHALVDRRRFRGIHKTRAELRSEAGHVPRVVGNEEALYAFMPSKRRKVGKQGIQHQRFTYRHDSLDPLMGKEVEIRWENTDLSKVIVLCDGRFICVAVDAAAAPAKPSAAEARERRKMAREHVARVKATVDPVLVSAMDPLEYWDKKAKEKQVQAAALSQGRPLKTVRAFPAKEAGIARAMRGQGRSEPKPPYDPYGDPE